MEKKKKSLGNSGWLSDAVGVSSGSEFLDSTVGSNVFNAIAKGSLVLLTAF